MDRSRFHHPAKTTANIRVVDEQPFLATRSQPLAKQLSLEVPLKTVNSPGSAFLRFFVARTGSLPCFVFASDELPFTWLAIKRQHANRE